MKEEITPEDLLKEEAKEEKIENMIEGEINWLDDSFWDSWDKIVGHMKKLWGHKEEYTGEPPKWFFLAHSNDSIRGKPLLIQNTKVRLPLVRMAIKKEKDEETKEEIEIQSFYMLGEKFDKRHDGFQRDAFALDFYKYQIETPDDKSVYVFSQEKLPTDTSLLKGMLIELDDYSEMSRTMKLPSLSRIFFVKEAEPAIKTLPKEELVEFVKSKKINETEWMNHLVSHPFGSMNNFPLESEMLHSAQMLSGKMDGWPLHIGYVGPQGTRKTMGKGETTEAKFGDDKIIIDSGNSRLKGLIASYKGTVANPGYLAKQERIGIVDEIGKMIEAESKKHDALSTNILGELNPILEHKERLSCSGNTDSSTIKPTAKFMFLTNPVSNRATIGSHVGIIDPTTMSRILWWVQDYEEQEFVLGENGILRHFPQDIDKTIEGEINPPETLTSIYNWYNVVENRKKYIVLKKSRGKYIVEYIDKDTFLTIFDSCYSFLSNLDYGMAQKLADAITNRAKEPMRGVWRPRGLHHTVLIIDGLIKHRCLFREHDPTFTAKDEDYDLAERILVRMVKSWDTDMSPKEDYS